MFSSWRPLVHRNILNVPTISGRWGYVQGKPCSWKDKKSAAPERRHLRRDWPRTCRIRSYLSFFRSLSFQNSVSTHMKRTSICWTTVQMYQRRAATKLVSVIKLSRERLRIRTKMQVWLLRYLILPPSGNISPLLFYCLHWRKMWSSLVL